MEFLLALPGYQVNIMENTKRKKIILTGGHLSPLLAVLTEIDGVADVAVVGRKYTFEADKGVSLEYTLFKERKIAFYTISAARFQRKFTRRTIPALLKFPRSIWTAVSILMREKPNVVLTFGGYIGLPVALAAYLLRIPVVLHEQTQKAGVTNKIIGKIASRVCISNNSSRKYFPSSKTTLTGNPIRPEVFEIQKEFKTEKGLPILFVMGGSAGAHTLNVYVEYMLKSLLADFTVIHQTGDAGEYQDFARLSTFRRTFSSKMQNRYIIRKFIMPDEIGWLYKNSEVIFARAGANTVSELLTLGKKALLVPLSHGQHNEQLENAILYEESGLGDYVEEKNVQLNSLLSSLQALKDKKLDSEVELEGANTAAKKIASIVLKAAR